MREELVTIFNKYIDMAEVELFGNTFEKEEQDMATLIDETKERFKDASLGVNEGVDE